MSVHVVAPGLLTTLQDLGRHGYAHLGVATSGAMDSTALRLANILVNNAQNAAVLEITLRGPRLRFDHDSLIALTGADCEARNSGLPLPRWRPVAIKAGAEIEMRAMRHGARAYLAVSGGFDLPPILGSRSSDVNAGLGPLPRALVAGDCLTVGAGAKESCRALFGQLDATRAVAATRWSLNSEPWFESGDRRPVRIIAGSHFGALDAFSRAALVTHSFRIGADSNRVGFRLEGIPLALLQPIEMISTGVVTGTIQLTPSGVPIALTAESATTGGYPRIAHIAMVDQPRFAQLRPGDAVRFALVDRDAASRYFFAQEQALEKLEHTIAYRLRES